MFNPLISRERDPRASCRAKYCTQKLILPIFPKQTRCTKHSSYSAQNIDCEIPTCPHSRSIREPLANRHIKFGNEFSQYHPSEQDETKHSLNSWETLKNLSVPLSLANVNIDDLPSEKGAAKKRGVALNPLVQTLFR